MTANELAIVRSVIYASLFDYPLTLDQLHRSLLESSQTREEILATYRSSPLLQATIDCREGLFFARGRSALIGERRRREARSRTFIAVHRSLLTLVCALPFVRLVALSGSVAHLNIERGADLDLFVVTRGRRVWSTTVAIVLLAKLMRRRRTLCANFIVADSELALGQQDLFTANQVVHLKPLAGADVLADLLTVNPFVARFYPNARPLRAWELPLNVPAYPRAKAAAETLLAGPWWLVERVCRWAYRAYLRARAGSWLSPEQVRLGDACLKLHTRSHRGHTLERFDREVWQALDQGAALMNARSREKAGRLDQSGLTMAEPQPVGGVCSYKS